VTVRISSEEGWSASVEFGVWEASDPAIARSLQILCDYESPTYLPDRDWDYATIAVRRWVGGEITILTPEPESLDLPEGAEF
jgi:hypothetical protein